jgi:hypothetical protein
MLPSSLKAFQKYQENDLKHLGLVDFITKKYIKLLSFVNRWDEVIKILSF